MDNESCAHAGCHRTHSISTSIATQIGRFIWVQALTSLAVAVATWLALWYIGIAEPLVWGVLAGVLTIVPYFGPLIVTAGLAIGFTVAAGAFAGGPISGGAFNPAVGLGPILVSAVLGSSGALGNLWLYLLGPFVGGALAAAVYRLQQPAEATPQEALAARADLGDAVRGSRQRTTA